MATLPESVDYTDKDFDALRARLIALVKSVFPDWTRRSHKRRGRGERVSESASNAVGKALRAPVAAENKCA